jgi:hypothetical protein
MSMVALPIEIQENYIGFTITSGIVLFIIFIYSKYDDTEVVLCQLELKPLRSNCVACHTLSHIGVSY